MTCGRRHVADGVTLTINAERHWGSPANRAGKSTWASNPPVIRAHVGPDRVDGRDITTARKVS
jgi:hypothetical protein